MRRKPCGLLAWLAFQKNLREFLAIFLLAIFFPHFTKIIL